MKNFSEDLIADAYLHWLSLLRMWRTQVCHRLVSTSLRQRHYWDISTRLKRPFKLHRFLSTSAASPPHDALPSISTKSDNTTKNVHDASVQFENLGLNQTLSRQVISAIPNIIRPTTAQTALIPILQKLNDVIIRAHTGTGKSFGLLLGLLNFPRIILQSRNSEKRVRAISSIVVVPSKELALQYQYWAHQLFPKHFHPELSSVIQTRFRTSDIGIEEHLDQLKNDPPHVLVITANLLQDLIQKPRGSPILGIATLRTLVLDEADYLLDLPSRFPSHKQIWNHMKHPSAGLAVLNHFMRYRSTYSGGAPMPNAGLESSKRPRGTSDVNAEIRMKVHQGNDELQNRRLAGKNKKVSGKFNLAAPRLQMVEDRSLQLVVISATANAVLRHFLGGRTGWLRTGLRNERGEETGKWLDITGLSRRIKKADEIERMPGDISQEVGRFPLQLPRELLHGCVVVDEVPRESDGQSQPPWRNLNTAVARGEASNSTKTHGKEMDRTDKARNTHVVSPTTLANGTIDPLLLTMLAYFFASQSIQRGLALIPPTWSLKQTKSFLSSLDVPVREIHDANDNQQGLPQEVLFLLHSTNARGLDIPGGVSHVFNVGLDSVRDSTMYTHLAGRAARIGQQMSEDVNRIPVDSMMRPNEDDEQSIHPTRVNANPSPHTRPPGFVITLIRGLSVDQVRHNRKLRQSSIQENSADNDGSDKLPFVASSELKMALIYKRLHLRPQHIET